MRTLLALTFCAIAFVGCGPNRTHPMRMAWDSDAAVPPLNCVPNLDGQIVRSELQPIIGTPVHYLFSPSGEDRDVDLVGTTIADGDSHWDFGIDYDSDRVGTITALDPTMQWYASSFPSAIVAVPTDPSGAIDALYNLDDHGFYLLGLASHEMNPTEGQTLLPYATPIVLFQLPLVPGATWISASDNSGTLRGLPYAGHDTYENVVPAMGELVLPDLTFTQAMRVATRATISPTAGAPVLRRQTTFVFECFGQVASLTAPDGDDTQDFTTAASMQRFGL